MNDLSLLKLARKTILFLLSGLILSNLFFLLIREYEDVFVIIYSKSETPNWWIIFTFYLFLCEALGWLSFKLHVIWDFLISILKHVSPPSVKNPKCFDIVFKWVLLIIFPVNGGDYLSRKAQKKFLKENYKKYKPYRWLLEMHVHSLSLLIIIKLAFLVWFYNYDQPTLSIIYTYLLLLNVVWIAPIITMVIIISFPSHSEFKKPFWVEGGTMHEMRYAEALSLYMSHSKIIKESPLITKRANVLGSESKDHTKKEEENEYKQSTSEQPKKENLDDPGSAKKTNKVIEEAKKSKGGR